MDGWSPYSLVGDACLASGDRLVEWRADSMDGSMADARLAGIGRRSGGDHSSHCIDAAVV